MSASLNDAAAPADRELNAREARPRGGCVFCTYELERAGAGHIRAVPRATQVVQTRRGPRDLCGAHAIKRTWLGAPTHARPRAEERTTP